MFVYLIVDLKYNDVLGVFSNEMDAIKQVSEHNSLVEFAYELENYENKLNINKRISQEDNNKMIADASMFHFNLTFDEYTKIKEILPYHQKVEKHLLKGDFNV